MSPTITNSLGMAFVIVPKGKSWLGGGKDKLGDNPSHFSRTGGGKDAVKNIPDADLKRFPVEQVSWDQCRIFVETLNKMEKKTGWDYRLPTEAEWEYACRGGPMADKLDNAFDFYLGNRQTLCRRNRRTSKAATCTGHAKSAFPHPFFWACSTCTATCGSGATI